MYCLIITFFPLNNAYIIQKFYLAFAEIRIYLFNYRWTSANSNRELPFCHCTARTQFQRMLSNGVVIKVIRCFLLLLAKMNVAPVKNRGIDIDMKKMNHSSLFSACTTMCNVIETADKWKFIGTRVQLTWASTKFHMLTFCKRLRARYVYMFLVYMNFTANKKETKQKKWFMRMLFISSWYSKSLFLAKNFENSLLDAKHCCYINSREFIETDSL